MDKRGYLKRPTPSTAQMHKKKQKVKPCDDHVPHVNPVPDRINIYLRLMKTIPLEVDKSATIQKVRTEICQLEGVSMVNLKSLLFAGDWLHNHKKVVDYEIKNGSIINVFLDSGFRTRIHVKIAQKGKRIIVDVDMRDTVLAIKLRIQSKEGIAIVQQDLVFMGEVLDDRRVIASYNIEEGSTIYAFFRLGDTMQLKINLEENNRTLDLNVKSWYTILNVKNMIESMLGIHTHKQRLYLANLNLSDHRVLGDLNIGQGNTLKLASGLLIYVKLPTGKTTMLIANRAHTFLLVKRTIERNDSIHPEKQILYFKGKKLPEEGTLADYNIEDNAEIVLLIRGYVS